MSECVATWRKVDPDALHGLEVVDGGVDGAKHVLFCDGEEREVFGSEWEWHYNPEFWPKDLPVCSACGKRAIRIAIDHMELAARPMATSQPEVSDGEG